MLHPYELPHLERKTSLRRSIGLPVEKNKGTMPFPAIFTSLEFSHNLVKENLGADNFDLNQIAAATSRISVNMLLKMKRDVLAMETFQPFIDENDHPYLAVIKSLVVALMLGRLKQKTEINAFLDKLNKVIQPFIQHITRAQNPYCIFLHKPTTYSYSFPTTYSCSKSAT